VTELPDADEPSEARVIRHIGTLCRDWPGEVLDAGATTRVLNADGTAPPIFWTFNSGGEFPALAGQLPASQPIVGMRSLNQIVPPGKRAVTSAITDLASHYADTLLKRFGTGPCLVGGNCQAAEIAYHIALRLLEAGAEVLGFITLDAEWRLPLPVPVKLIFGRDSDRNPRRKFSEAQMAMRQDWWSAAFAGIEMAETPGGHGQYFRPENVPGLAQGILSARREAPFSFVPSAGRWILRTEASGEVSLSLPPGEFAACVDRLRLIQISDGGGVHPPIAAPYSGLLRPAGLVEGCVQFRLPPYTSARTQVVLCLQDTGPLSWPFCSLPEMPLSSVTLSLPARILTRFPDLGIDAG